ncbi:MAG: hypothetical protein PHU25_08685 [Deltaproteobacteria bacterium]|nr:hypothetical protein [Deltaproteobacteria bacterium]
MSRIGFVAPDLRRLEGVPADAVVIFRFSDPLPFAGAASLVDWRMLGHLSSLAIRGFLTGEEGEALLMPFSGRLPQRHLLVFGLGPRAGFCEAVFERAFAKMLDTVLRLGGKSIAACLPGRAEGLVPPEQAAQWLLPLHEEQGEDCPLTLIEPLAAQKIMAQVLEKWRLRRLVP